MLFDDAAQIFLATRRGDQADLLVLSHDLAIEMETRLRILLKRPLRDEPGEILPPFGVNFRRVDVSGGGQVDLGLADMKETQRIARGHQARFV